MRTASFRARGSNLKVGESGVISRTVFRMSCGQLLVMRSPRPLARNGASRAVYSAYLLFRFVMSFDGSTYSTSDDVVAELRKRTSSEEKAA